MPVHHLVRQKGLSRGICFHLNVVDKRFRILFFDRARY